MSKQIRITLLIDIPEGVATPDVDYGDLPQEPAELRAVAEQVFAGMVKEEPQAIRPVQSGPVCQEHGPMVRFPAGTSKKPPYKDYNASWRCDVKGCTTKPIWDKDAA